jgi:sec-independent protein translocase protein TatB
MLPGMGGLELVVIALIALVVVGPKDLPIMLRKLGKVTGKVRGMAQEFRNSFDELARQSELDELRKEVENLRAHSMQPLGPELEDHFREIGADLRAEPQLSVDPNWTDPALTAPETAPLAGKRPRAKSSPKKASSKIGAETPPAKAPRKRAPKVASDADAVSERMGLGPATKRRRKTDRKSES